MKATPSLTYSIGEALFNIHMNIFQGQGEVKFPLLDLIFDSSQATYNSICISLGYDLLLS